MSSQRIYILRSCSSCQAQNPSQAELSTIIHSPIVPKNDPRVPKNDPRVPTK